MKSITIVFNDKEKSYVPNSLYKNLEYIFEDHVKIKTCFLDEVDENEILESDIFLVLYENRVYSMKHHVPNMDKIIVISRTIKKNYFDKILNIPTGTSVLIVNDSYESTVQTANTFYELGINHLNLIPYVEGMDYEAYYKDIKIAITPNEVNNVPKFIKTILNVGDRYLDVNTIMKIINKLQLNNKNITRNLIKYMNSIVQPDAEMNKKYLDNHLKSEMLNKVIHNSSEIIIMTDHNYNLVYSNDVANTLFDIDDVNMGLNIKKFVDNNLFDLITHENLTDKVIKINELNYILDKSPVMILDQIVGYCITLKNEQDIKNLEIKLSNQIAKNGLYAKYSFDNIVYSSEKMVGCISLSKKAAMTDFTVLINGESGTGKELIAQSIHNYSQRKNNPFVAINCAALPESLLESELFGYERGSFTGAMKNGKLGLFEQADSGTIFLDEIGDMSLNLQARLLRVLQEKQIMRIGSDRVINVDIRIISATNKNLREKIANGNFREDLFYRLNIIPIHLPPLRERKEDIPLILKAFLSDEYNKLTKSEKDAIVKYSWPGNVRELENTAKYYKTTGELQHNIFSIPKSQNSNLDNTIISVLQTINENTTPSSGIGRTLLTYKIKKNNITVSDSKMRELLEYMKEKGYIEIFKGRTGNKITQYGINFLGEQNLT